jgi:hypothetical protein
MIVQVSDFSGYDEGELSPERDIGKHKCLNCGMYVNVWMRGWMIAKQEACHCADGKSRSMSILQSALKED